MYWEGREGESKGMIKFPAPLRREWREGERGMLTRNHLTHTGQSQEGGHTFSEGLALGAGGPSLPSRIAFGQLH